MYKFLSSYFHVNSGRQKFISFLIANGRRVSNKFLYIKTFLMSNKIHITTHLQLIVIDMKTFLRFNDLFVCVCIYRHMEAITLLHHMRTTLEWRMDLNLLVLNCAKHPKDIRKFSYNLTVTLITSFLPLM